MSSRSTTQPRLHFIANSPVRGLAVAERRVPASLASVICVHGALDRGGSFVRLVRRLARFDVVVYDRRGYQGSRALGPVSLAAHVEDLSALITSEAERGPVILFGHSYGGLVALGAAIADPSGVDLVVDYESPLPWVLHRENRHAIESDDPVVEAERFFRRIMGDRAWERLGEDQRDSRRRDGVALLDDLKTVRRPKAPFDLRALHVPTTYAYGDEVDYYRALAPELVALNPIIKPWELHEAGHAAHLKNANQLATLIEDRWAATCASG